MRKKLIVFLKAFVIVSMLSSMYDSFLLRPTQLTASDRPIGPFDSYSCRYIN